MSQSKNSVGRPTAMTKDVINNLEMVFSVGGSDVQACHRAGISRQTLYNYQANNPKFLDRKKALRDLTALQAKIVVASAIENNDVDVAKWYLERKCKDEFSLRNEVSGPGGGAIELESVKSLTNKQLIELSKISTEKGTDYIEGEVEDAG